MLLNIHSSALLIAAALFLSVTAAAKDLSNAQLMSLQNMQQDTCDKITNLELSICYGDTIQVGGENYSDPGNYTDTLTAENGCDSIIFLNLIVNPIHFTSVSVTICEYEVYIFGGEILTNTGSYTITLTTENGCDSIVELSLEIRPSIVSYIESTICEGGIIDIYGQIISAEGIYPVYFIDSYGCDSIVTHVITFEKLEVPVTILENSLIAHQSAASYQWIDCDTDENIPGANSQSFIPSQSGNYSVSIILEDSCIGTSDCIEFLITGTAENSISNAVSIYPNPTDGLIYITNDSGYHITSADVCTFPGQQIEKFTLSGKNTLDLSLLEKGVYLIKLEINNTQVTKKVIIR